MKKKLFYPLIALALIIATLFGSYLYISRQPLCKDGRWPIPPPATLGFGTYNLITDQGPLYIGQTYNHRNEGSWVGNMTLVFIDNKGALLLFRYPKGTGKDFKIMVCRGYITRTPENTIEE